MLKASDDNMDQLDDEELAFIKDGSPPLASMDMNMLFTLPVEFKGTDQEIPQLFLCPKKLCLRSLRSRASI
jgi:hypothetical protein